MMMRAEPLCVALGLGCLLFGCGAGTVAGSGEASTSAASSTSAGANTSAGATEGAGTSTSTSTSTSTTAPTTSTGSPGSGSTSTGQAADDTGLPPPGFLNHEDVSPSIECSMWAENCPPGEKCMPVANDGGNSWNAAQCRPVVDNPAGIGESCSLTMGTGVDGYDTCEKHAMCWDVDSETGEGSCVGMCVGSEAAPTCFEADSICTITGGAVWALCFPTCDPLLQNCGDGETCFPSAGNFVCGPVGAAAGQGALAGACEFTNGCQPGLYCGNGDGFCSADAPTCCLPFCELSQPQCPDPLDCTPALEPGTAPAVLEDVGLCGAG